MSLAPSDPSIHVEYFIYSMLHHTPRSGSGHHKQAHHHHSLSSACNLHQSSRVSLCEKRRAGVASAKHHHDHHSHAARKTGSKSPRHNTTFYLHALLTPFLRSPHSFLSILFLSSLQLSSLPHLSRLVLPKHASDTRNVSTLDELAQERPEPLRYRQPVKSHPSSSDAIVTVSISPPSPPPPAPPVSLTTIEEAKQHLTPVTLFYFAVCCPRFDLFPSFALQVPPFAVSVR
ncbi:hypothetical protein EX30DRAFT_1720 [Ascodesmis nigricans]|uniref:Uncharacterized protein n=1 Tax=Ascodesmis nigricans TaxID=341454 RepID=A0A4S2N5R4_9PEZI|nr:hypothetical protein EX30DRAFT_1720 [Ascodesmis nigricans]